MSEKGKAPVSVGTLNEAVAETSGALNSYRQTIMGEQKNQAEIAALLHSGEKNAVSTRELLTLTGYTTVRQLQRQIEAERTAGALILSSTTGGYYLPSDGEAGRAEILRYEATLRKRAVNTLRTLKTARRALAQLDGQLEMEGDDGQ